MKTLVVDGNNAAWRLMKRLPELSVKGQQVQIVYGMMRLLRNVLVQFRPNVVLVCWDLGKSAWRMKAFPAYKAHRSHSRTEADKAEFSSFMNQTILLQDVLTKLNVAQVAYPETEADDLMAVACDCLDGEKVIVSSDQDMLHLVRRNVSVWSPNKTMLYNHKNFHKEIGMTPNQWLDFRALTGDSSDGIPGVAKGFGETSAKELIQKYGSLEEIFRSKVQKRIMRMGNRMALICTEEARLQAYLNLTLMDLRTISIRPGREELVNLIQKSVAARHKVKRSDVQHYFTEKKFVSLLADLPKFLSAFEDLDS